MSSNLVDPFERLEQGFRPRYADVTAEVGFTSATYGHAYSAEVDATEASKNARNLLRSANPNAVYRLVRVLFGEEVYLSEKVMEKMMLKKRGNYNCRGDLFLRRRDKQCHPAKYSHTGSTGTRVRINVGHDIILTHNPFHLLWIWKNAYSRHWF